MKITYKITIPESCQEDWNKMTPNNNGCFCDSCAKTVIDFSVMLPAEIQDYFRENGAKNLCGRFKKSQLDTLTIQIPSRVLYSQTSYHKMFLLALFVAMGTTLFSCKNNNDEKQKIDKVEVVTSITKPKDSLEKNVPPAFPQTKLAEVIDVMPDPPSTNGVMPIYEETIAGGIGLYVEYPNVLAEYPGGKNKFYDFFKSEFQIPKNYNKEIREIHLSFVIEKDGALVEPKIISNFAKEFEEEAIRVLKV
jgi:hypothetical protein